MIVSPEPGWKGLLVQTGVATARPGQSLAEPGPRSRFVRLADPGREPDPGTRSI